MPLQWLVRPIICSPTLMNWFGGQTARDEHAYVEYANACVASRIASSKVNSQERRDVMYHMLNARDPVSNMPFSKLDLDAESSLLIAAGADTTSTTLAAAMFYLTLPDSRGYLEELTQQLRESFEDFESICGSRIVTKPLLRAVAEETLRLSPSVPTHLPRMVVKRPGITIAGRFIPAGTIVGSSAYVLHRNLEAYPQPDAFKPERWIVQERAATDSLQHPDQVALAKEAFCAFSLGSRGCVGKSLAYMELAIALGRLLWSFDVRRAAGTDATMTARTVSEGAAKGWTIHQNEYQLKDRFLAERDGPMVEFRPRQ
jgi:cytochrome P450